MTGTIRDLIARSSAGDESAPAILDIDGAATSYRQLLHNVDAISSAVAAAGVARNRAVAVVLPNGPLMATTFLGVASAAVCAPLNPAYTESELSFFYDDLDIGALVTDGCSAAALELAERRGVRVLQPPFTATACPPPAAPDEVALVLHTSGTTARPKQVPLTHANLCTSAGNVARSLCLGTTDRCFNVMPLFHIHGIVAALLGGLRAGGSIVCTPGFDATQFLPSAARLDATWYTAVPTMHQAVLAAARRDPEQAAACRFRLIRSSSAALPPTVMHDLEALFAAPVIEAYGMTEASHQMASNPLPPAVRKPGTVGVAAGPEIAIMGAGGSLLPAGATGEIVIRGSTVTAGYIADDSVNAEAFADGWFRTGDQGVVDGDGYLTITGRLKEIINRGGEKISPREVEEVLLTHPHVAQAVAFAVPHPTMGEDVAAAVVPADGADVDPEDLRSFVATQLSVHKVPQRVVVRVELPLGPTGKLQRIGMAQRLGILDQPPPTGREDADPDNASMSPLERATAAVWEGLLGLEHVGRDALSIDLGGDSLTAVTLVAEIDEVFGVLLPVTAPLVEAPTVALMAAMISGQRSVPASRRDDREDGDGDVDEGALSIAEEGMWFVEKTNRAASTLHIPVALRLLGSLDVDALQRSIAELIRRHDGLRTRFVVDADGRPRATVDAAAEFRLSLEDHSAVPEGDRNTAARAAIESDSLQGFDVTVGPLFRARLLRFADEDHVLTLVIHHLVADGWSRGSIRNELAILYRAARDGVDADLSPPRARFAEFVAREQRRIASGAMDEAFAYWQRVLTPLPPTVTLPADRRRPLADRRSGVVRTVVPADERTRLAALARDEDATLFMVLLAGFVATLHRHTGLTDIVVGVPVAGRTDLRSHGVVGSMVNILPVRIAVEADTPFVELVRRVRTACLDAYAHQEVPLDLLVRRLRPERSTEHLPLVQVLFQLRNLPAVVSDLGDVRIEDIDVLPGASQYEVSVDVIERDGELRLAVEYPTGRFDGATIEWFVRHLVVVLSTAPVDPARSVAALNVVSEDEVTLLNRFGSGASLSPSTQPVHELVARVAAASPHRVAVEMAGAPSETLTYGELNERANQLAHHLNARGVTAGDAVAVCVPRSFEMLVAALGVLKAGAAYVPLDLTNPVDRLRAIVTDADVTALVSIDALLDSMPDPPDCVVLLDGAEIDRAPMEDPKDAPGSGSSVDRLAYVMFTSGSTGRPKGVEVEHRQLSAYIAAAQAELQLTDSDRVLATTTLSFDPSIDELWLPLTVGARVVLADDELRLDARRLVRLLNDGAVTLIAGTPTLAGYLIEAGWQPGDVTSMWIGEILNPSLAAELLTRSPTVWNRYGPTETTNADTFHRVTADDVEAQLIPIGHPIAGQVLRVVESSGELAGVGIEGDLLIGGLGVTRGYRGRPDLTAAAFITVQTESGPARMYRSGDRCRWRSNGTLEFLGRADGQVKFRGVRIELGEIEAALMAHPGVTSAVADVRGDRLVAWITGPPPAPQTGEVRGFIAEKLPRPMFPSVIQWLEELPVSATGKVDRRGLPDPSTDEEASGTPPVGPTEERLARLWRECLGLDGGVYRDSDFFELGGHSMLAVELSFSVEREFGRELPLTWFLSAPTLSRMAAALDTDSSDGLVEPCGPNTQSLLPVKPGDVNLPLLLWVPATGGTPLQLKRLARLLPPEIELMGFEAPPHRGEPEPETFSALATSYADDVRRLARAGTIGPHRPFVLGGNSFGGTLAHEIANLLYEDCPPGAVILVDPRLVPRPDTPQVESGSPDRARARWRASRARRVLCSVRSLRRQKSVRPVGPGAALPAALEQARRMSHRLRKTHQPRPYPGSVVLFATEARQQQLGDEFVQVRQFVQGEIVLHVLPGQHGGLFNDERAHQITAVVADVVRNLAPT